MNRVGAFDFQCHESIWAIHDKVHFTPGSGAPEEELAMFGS